MCPDTVEETPTWIRPTSGGGLLVVLASVALSTGANGAFGEQLRVRWSAGPHYYVGPEHVPTAAALVAFPAAAAVLYVGARWLGRRLRGADGFTGARPLYEVAVGGTLAAVVLVQVALVLANVYL